MEKRYLILMDKDFKALVFANNDKEAKEKFDEYLEEYNGLFTDELWELVKVIEVYIISDDTISEIRGKKE